MIENNNNGAAAEAKKKATIRSFALNVSQKTRCCFDHSRANTNAVPVSIVSPFAFLWKASAP